MKNIFKSFVIMLATAFVLTACGGSSDSGPGATPAGTFTKQFGVTGASNNYPLHGAEDVKAQYLYTAEEIGASGMITKIRLRQEGLTTTIVTCPNTTIKMGHTNRTALVGNWADNIEEGQGSEQTVLDNKTISIPIATPETWIDIQLDTPFNYNGVDNLVVDFEKCTECSATVATTRFIAANSRRNLSFATDNTAGTAEFNTTAGSPDTALQWMQFVFAGGDNIAVAPETLTTGSYYPFGPTAGGLRVQQLYMAGEINGSGPITGIAFPVADAATAAETYTITVKLGHTNLAELTDTFANNINVGSTVTVANSATFNVPAGIPAGTYIWLPLPDGTFSYNGTDNLVVEIQSAAAATETLDIQRAGKTNGRLYGALGAPTGTLNSMNYAIKFRFYGGQVIVACDAGSTSTQVLGNGDAGQIQSLYNNSLLGTGGSITGVYVRLYSSSSVAANLTNYKLYMGHTIKTIYNVSDAYSANMDENSLVFSGTLSIPSGLLKGDWVKIPLSSPFAYNSSKNLSILFATDPGPVGNTVSAKLDAAMLPVHSVGRNDNSASSTGYPGWSWDGIVEIALDIVK